MESEGFITRLSNIMSIRRVPKRRQSIKFSISPMFSICFRFLLHFIARLFEILTILVFIWNFNRFCHHVYLVLLHCVIRTLVWAYLLKMQMFASKLKRRVAGPCDKRDSQIIDWKCEKERRKRFPTDDKFYVSDHFAKHSHFF